MANRIPLLLSASVTILLLTTTANAGVLFQDDFENERVTTPNPVLSWKPAFHPTNYPTGSMYGDGDMFSRSNAIKLEGDYSLQLLFNGRNNWCNLCDKTTHTMTSGYADVGYFIDSDGTNFSTLLDTSNLPAYKIYNRDKYFSVSSITGVSSSRIDVVTDKTGMNGSKNFHAGDTVFIAKQCSAGQRRSDCNLTINYLENLRPEHYTYGSTLSRRMYFYLPSSTTLPNTTLKLGYAKFEAGNTWSLISVQRGEFGVANQAFSEYGYGPSFKRNTWYYIEEVWTRETSLNAGDGSYKMFLDEAEKAHITTPAVIHHTGINTGGLEALSIMGNTQNTNDAIGAIFFDAILVGQERSGPIALKPRPETPKNLEYRKQ